MSTGLSTELANAKLQTDGPNALPKKKGVPLWRKFLSQFNSPLIYMLIIVMIFCFATVQIPEGVVIFAVIVINATIGFFQEYKADQDNEALLKYLAKTATVLRDSKKSVILAEDLVVGDIIFLTNGDKVPADCRLIAADNFSVNESALTGESEKRMKNTATLQPDVGLSEQSNMAFSGTEIVTGTGMGVVVQTGVRTEVGKIHRLASETKTKRSALERHLDNFDIFCIVVVIILMIISFVSNLLVNWGKVTISQALILAAAIGVAVIPEGFPIIRTLSTTVGVKRMAAANARVKDKSAVETLGAVNVICSDKTGTLTTNQMTVRAIRTAKHTYKVTGSGYDPLKGQVSTLKPGEVIDLEDRVEDSGPTAAEDESPSDAFVKLTSDYARAAQSGRQASTVLYERGKRHHQNYSTQSKKPEGESNSTSLFDSDSVSLIHHFKPVVPRSRPFTPIPLTGPLDTQSASIGAAHSTGHSGASTPRSPISPSGSESHPQLKTLMSPSSLSRTPAASPLHSPRLSPSTSFSSIGVQPHGASHVGSLFSPYHSIPASPLIQPATGTPSAPYRDSDYPFDDPRLLRMLCRCAILCNDASLKLDENKPDQWILQGDTTEGSFYPMAIKCGASVNDYVAFCPRVDCLPFDSENGYMAAVHRCPTESFDRPLSTSTFATLSDNQEFDFMVLSPDASTDLTARGHDICFLKGAVEHITRRCTHQYTTDKHGNPVVEPINVQFWTEEAQALARTGLRTLALAQRILSADRFANPQSAQPPTTAGAMQLPVSEKMTHEELEGFTMLGLIGVFDPPRPESLAAVQKCKQAGIDVVMITGDHKDTAQAIGRLVGLKGNVRTSAELKAKIEEYTGHLHLDEKDDPIEHMTPAQREDYLGMGVEIYARATPTDKHHIVKAMQLQGKIAAMTGDGVNDAPALKEAHVGFSMGQNGTEVAMEASKIILTDDNFATIVKAVEEGRRVFNSLKRAILFICPTHMAEAIATVGCSFIGSVAPLNALQILYVNTITSICLSSMIPLQRGESNVLSERPRDRNKSPFTSTVIVRSIVIGSIIAAVLLTYFYTFVDDELRHMTDEQLEAVGKLEFVHQQSAVALNLIVIPQIFFLFNTIYIKKPTFSLSVFRAFGWETYVAVSFLLLCQFALVYVPGLNTLFGNAPMEWWQWLVAVTCGVLVYFIAELDKWLRRWRRRGTPFKSWSTSRTQEDLETGGMVSTARQTSESSSTEEDDEDSEELEEFEPNTM